MRLTVRLRLLIASLAAMVIGYGYLSWAIRLGENIIRSYRSTNYVDCGSALSSIGYSCDPTTFSPTFSWVLLVVVSLIVLAVLLALAVWVLRPLTDITEAIRRLGPQNLNERTSLPGRDAVARLGGAINGMLDRLAEGYEGQRRFAANASHELRTPLAVQRTLIEVGLSSRATPDQLDLLSRQLLRTNERNEALIEGLLVLAESDRGLASRTPQRLDLIVAETMAMHEHLAAAAGIELISSTTELTVPGEFVLLQRLVANLVANAIKYNRTDGRVWLRVGGESGLTVSNTGPVVGPATVASLFEPFRRGTTDRLDHSGGSGLGLTIARSITQAHGGRIDAVADPRGGLNVTVMLPAVPASLPGPPSTV